MAETFALDSWGVTSEDILKTQFPMHRACRDGDVESLAILLSEGQHSVYEEDSFYGWTPAHWAAYFGKLSCIMWLLEKGFHPDRVTKKLRQTALHLAAFAGSCHCSKWLLHHGAKLDIQDYLGETAIHKAARTGSMECVSLLASHGANLIVINNNGHSCSQVATMCGHASCSEFLEEYAARQRAQGISNISTNAFNNGHIQPACHDVTTGSVIPCVPIQSNGHSLPANGHANGFSNGFCDDNDMDCSDNVTSLNSAATTATDITLDCRVSQNIVTIGGRKRSREELHEVDNKRARINGSAPLKDLPNCVLSQPDEEQNLYESSAEDYHKMLMSQHGYNSMVVASFISSYHGS